MNTTLQNNENFNLTFLNNLISNVTTDLPSFNLEGISGETKVFGKHEFIQTKPWTAIPTIVILSLASFVGTAGNILTLLAIASSRNLRNVEAIFIVNLAISDLYVTMIADPMSIVAKLEGEHFFNGVPKLCQIIANLCTISCVTSLMTIATMSFNRYIYVCRSDYYHIIFSKQNSIIICCFLYCIGLILVLLNQAGIGDHTFDRKSLECIWDRMATFSYTVVFSVTLVWIPCLIIGVCYLKLYLFVRRHKKKVNNHRSGITNLVVPTIPSKPQPQLGKTFVLIYAVFVICWAPYALLIVLDLEDSFPHEIHLYITMFAHLHPSINWLIYYLTHRKISLAYCRLLGIKKGNTSTFSKNFTFGDDRGSKIQVKEELNNPGGNNNREIERDSVQNDPALVSKTNIVAKSEVGACYQDNVEKSENSGIDCKVCGKSQNSQRVKNAQEPIHEAKVSVELHLSVSFHNESSPADITEELNQISQAENGSKILKNSKSQDLFHKQISDPDVDITGGTSKFDNSDSLMTCIQDVNVTELERYTTVELTKAVTTKTS